MQRYAMSRPRKPVEQTTSTTYRGADGHWHARVTMGRRPDGTTERKHVQRRTKAELRDAGTADDLIDTRGEWFQAASAAV